MLYCFTSGCVCFLVNCFSGAIKLNTHTHTHTHTRMSHLFIKYFWTEEMGILKITADDLFLVLAEL